MNGENFSGERVFKNEKHRALINWRVTDGELTIRGELHLPGITWQWGTFLNGGQCEEMIAKAFPENDMVQQICKIWDRWHLNHMRTGNQLQEDALRKWQLAGNKYDYEDACAYLESLGLNKTLDDLYGMRWHQEELPESILATVKSWGCAQNVAPVAAPSTVFLQKTT
jgi:hypothetical protein